MHIFNLLLALAFSATPTLGLHQNERRNHTNYAARNLATVQSIYTLATYPNNLGILANGSSAVPPGLFNANASGRVTPLGNFTGFDDSTEYFFALSQPPSAPLYTALTEATIVEFTSGCPEVAASVVYLKSTVVHPNATNNGQYVSTLKEIAFWRFDDEGAVLYYDAWIPNLEVWTSIEGGGANFSSPAVQAGTIESLCTNIQGSCVGANVQYNSTAQCIQTLSGKTFGTYDEVWGDNVVCRTIHLLLTYIRPEVHCPHVGPTGGMKCVDVDYNTVYIADDQYLFDGAAIGSFQCPMYG